MTVTAPAELTTRKRILFVDDDVGVLDGLRLALRRRRHEWDMEFACGGQAGLNVIANRPFDVVVSDVRMPEVDGERLLREVQRRWPAAVRIVLSGHTDQEASRRLICVAHQFLAKPCDRDVLSATLDRACELHGVLQSEQLRALVGGLGELPAAPGVYIELGQLSDSGAPLSEIARVIQRDPALTAKVLQVVNSAFFTVRRQVTSLERAVSLLGAESTRTVVLSVEAYRVEPGPAVSRTLLDELYDHVTVTARIARRLAPPKERDLAFIAGVLHAIGVLVYATKMPVPYAGCLRESRNGSSLEEVERARFGVTHSALGGYLLGLWGIVPTLVDGIVRYPAPVPPGGDAFDLATLVHVACRLAHEHGHPSAESRPLAQDMATRIGPRLDEWRARTAEELAASEER